MSVSKWAYTPEKCDGGYCYGDCDNCPKANEEGDDSHKITNRDLIKQCREVSAINCANNECKLKEVCEKWKKKHRYAIPSTAYEFMEELKPEWLDKEVDQ